MIHVALWLASALFLAWVAWRILKWIGRGLLWVIEHEIPRILLSGSIAIGMLLMLYAVHATLTELFVTLGSFLAGCYGLTAVILIWKERRRAKASAKAAELSGLEAGDLASRLERFGLGAPGEWK